MANMSESIIRLICRARKNDNHIQGSTPRIANGVAPVNDGGQPDRCGDGGKMDGFRVRIRIYRGGDGQPRAIPDEICVWEWECENSVTMT